MTAQYFNLGTYSLPISTPQKDAQMWFDRGLNWTFGYNHQEAITCFQNAAKIDPKCAMAYWGIAYASGPNYNMPWHVLDEDSRAKALAQSYDATQCALAECDHATSLEQALINALTARYPQRQPIDDMRPWNHNFANEMRKVFAAFSHSQDACAIFAESLLNLTPWKMWNLADGKPKEGAHTDECQKVLETAFASIPHATKHPGILHCYVHLMEMSPAPEKALKAGDTLRTLCPDAGHLVHMATHIDVLCGHYQDVIYWNQRAIEADLAYFRKEGANNLYTGYRLHNYHFLIYGGMLLGQLQPAIAAIREMKKTTPLHVLQIESPPMADYLESYLALEPHVLIRFGRWNALTEMRLPDNKELFATLVANTHYGRAMAFAALGKVTDAENEQQLFQSAQERVPETRLLHNNKVRELLKIATETLEGEIAYRKADYQQAFTHLRKAVELEDNLPYDEPWGWMQPSRHALGALLFEQGHIEAAEAAYREDLGFSEHLSRATIHPDNVWALKGLYDCLLARDEKHDIKQIKYRLDIAIARADQDIKASCFCAQVAMNS